MPIEKTTNFIRIRVSNPKQFIRFRVKTLGKGIKAVIGYKKGGGSQIQSVLFPRSRYTLAQAKAWVKKHGYTVSESFLVTDISINLDTNELVITETVAKNNDSDDTDNEKSKSLAKSSKEIIKWLIKS